MFSDFTACSFDVKNMKFYGFGNEFSFHCLCADGITQDANPCFYEGKYVRTSATTTFTYQNGTSFDLIPINMDPAKNYYEFEVKNEKGNFTIFRVRGKLI